MKRRLLYTLLACLIGLAMPACAGDDGCSGARCTFSPTTSSDISLARPSVLIPWLGSVPKIDGVLKPGEWNGAGEIAQLLVPAKTQAAPLKTQGWVAVDSKFLYAAFRCQLLDGKDPKAAATEHDGMVWEDDSIEFFIRPDASKPEYYQFTANCAGVQLDMQYWYNGPDAVDNSMKWSCDWRAKTGREADAWTLEIAIPLSEIEMPSQGTRAAGLNIVRNIWQDKRVINTWSCLSTVGYDVNTHPDQFGIGVFAFGQALNSEIDAGKMKDLSGLDALSTRSRSHITIIPNAYHIEACVALPEQVVAGATYKLQASVARHDSTGKTQSFHELGEYKLRGVEPVRVSVSGLSLGDYTLRLRALGPGLAVAKDHLVTVRVPVQAPEVVGDIIVDDSDWRDPNAVTASSWIEHQMTSELLLQTLWQEPVPAFDPTSDESITCMVDYKGRLYIGSCTKPAMTDTGSVFTYDPDLDVWEKAFQVNEQGLVKMKVFGDKLYIPGYDANDGLWDLGNIYIHDGDKWVEKRTVPRAVHIYDLVVYHDRIYVSAGVFDAPPKGEDFKQESAEDGTYKIYGRVWSSGDGGETWREEYRSKQEEQNTGYMTVFKDKIILSADGDIITYDDIEWKPMGLNPPVLFITDYADTGDVLLLGTGIGLFCYDGERIWKAQRPWVGHIFNFTRYGDCEVYTDTVISGGRPSYGPGGTDYPLIQEKGIRFYPKLTACPNSALGALTDVGPYDSSLYPEMKRYKSVGTETIMTSCCGFRGRLYLGSHPEGQVYVLPAASSGSLTSTPHKVDKPGKYRLWWNGSTPPGTSVSFQVRSASNIEELGKQPFVGPSGKPGSSFSAQGEVFAVSEAGFVQYRVMMKTDNPAKTPYVKRVVITEE